MLACVPDYKLLSYGGHFHSHNIGDRVVLGGSSFLLYSFAEEKLTCCYEGASKQEISSEVRNIFCPAEAEEQLRTRAWYFLPSIFDKVSQPLNINNALQLLEAWPMNNKKPRFG